MSYNVDSTQMLDGADLWIHPDDLARFFNEQEVSCEGLREMADGYGLHPEPSPAGLLQFKEIPFWGESSGRDIDVFFSLLELTKGSADLLLCWEGGDDYSGYRVQNGTVVAHKVVFALGEKA
jgi:hypothetical protein